MRRRISPSREDKYHGSESSSRHRRRDRRDNNDPYNKYNNNKKRSPRRSPHRRGREVKSSFLTDMKGQSESMQEWGVKATKTESKEDNKNSADKEKPNFGLSGKLTEDTNMVNGVVIKYSQPSDARKPKRRWRLYPFKGEKVLPILHIHRQSAYLMGRDRKIADIPLDHPSCSKQHAALQYRLVPFTRENGTEGKRVRPYLIDLESANGTYINSVKMEPRKYYEIIERDVIKFGFSSREYVLLHEESKDDALDEDVQLSNN